MTPPRRAGWLERACRARLTPLALALVVLAVAPACPRHATPAPGAAPVPRPRVVVETASGASHGVTVELARTDAEREHGLMGRRDLAEDQGMLFLFLETADRAFWMKNTLIPLDMIFIDDGGRVAGIVAEAQPLTLTPRTPGVPARFVLEVRGGWAARHGVAPGDRVRFESVPLQ